jgi:hypothetical protein
MNYFCFRRLRLALLLAIGLSSTGPLVIAQDAPKDGWVYERLAVQAYRTKDYAAFLE